MLLVPRQLQRAGMTGNVPYYGGRLTPAQAYAASHPSAPAPGPGLVSVPARAAVGSSAPGAGGSPPASGSVESLRSLQHLLDAGVITADEYAGLRARLGA